MMSRIVREMVAATVLALVIAAPAMYAVRAQAPQTARPGSPDLIGMLKATPGVLGVDAGQMMSGKQEIFTRISHFFARDKSTFAVAAGREHVIDITMAELTSRLDGRRFVRIHRGTIVNVAFVQELSPGIDGLILRLKDDHRTELSVARDRVRDLKERLGI